MRQSMRQNQILKLGNSLRLSYQKWFYQLFLANNSKKKVHKGSSSINFLAPLAVMLVLFSGRCSLQSGVLGVAFGARRPNFATDWCRRGARELGNLESFALISPIIIPQRIAHENTGRNYRNIPESHTEISFMK